MYAKKVVKRVWRIDSGDIWLVFVIILFAGLLIGCGGGGPVVTVLTTPLPYQRGVTPGPVDENLDPILLFGAYRGDNSIGATWAGKIASIGYELYRSTDPGDINDQYFLVYAGEQASYRDEYFATDVTYYYKVRYMVESGAWSPFSPVDSVLLAEKDYDRDAISFYYCVASEDSFTISGPITYSQPMTIAEGKNCTFYNWTNVPSGVYTLTCPNIDGREMTAGSYYTHGEGQRKSAPVTAVVNPGEKAWFNCDYDPRWTARAGE